MNQNNVTPITSAQPQTTATFTITAMIDGFPVQIAVEGKADALRGMIDRLKAIGAQPPKANHDDCLSMPAKNAAPTCPAHGTPMKQGRRGWFCPKKVGDDYCKEVA